MTLVKYRRTCDGVDVVYRQFTMPSGRELEDMYAYRASSTWYYWDGTRREYIHCWPALNEALDKLPKKGNREN